MTSLGLVGALCLMAIGPAVYRCVTRLHALGPEGTWNLARKSQKCGTKVMDGRSGRHARPPAPSARGVGNGCLKSDNAPLQKSLELNVGWAEPETNFVLFEFSDRVAKAYKLFAGSLSFHLVVPLFLHWSADARAV